MPEKSITTLLLLIVILVIINKSYAESMTLKPLAKQSAAKPFCGIKAYNQKRESSCGVEFYKIQRTVVCGVEQYRLKPHINCPGSIAYDQYYNRDSSPFCSSNAHADSHCRDGYKITEHIQETRTCHHGHGESGVELESIKYEHYQCTRIEDLKACRGEFNGVESYKACRDKNHGVESYKACRKPEFGVESYNTCSYYLEPHEIRAYIDANFGLIGFFAESMLVHEGNFYAFVNNQNGLACTIKSMDQSPLFRDKAQELKSLYIVAFGDAYNGDIDCSQQPDVSIDAYQCPQDRRDRICNSVRGYMQAKQWLHVKKIDANNLLIDIIAKQDANINNKINLFKEEMVKYENAVK